MSPLITPFPFFMRLWWVPNLTAGSSIRMKLLILKLKRNILAKWIWKLPEYCSPHSLWKETSESPSVHPSLPRTFNDQATLKTSLPRPVRAALFMAYHHSCASRPQ